ncbi:MAG: transglutaminase domain-containing protein [Actinomycetes bacterium]
MLVARRRVGIPFHPAPFHASFPRVIAASPRPRRPADPRVERIQSRVQTLGAPTATDGTVVGYPIAGDRPDAESIVQHLQSLVEIFGRHPDVRAAALRIITSTKDNDQPHHAAMLLGWVRSRMVYLADPDGAEWFISPLVTLATLAAGRPAYGDCDDHVLMLGSLLQSIGIPVVVQGVKLNGPNYDHVMLAALINGRWTDMDPCAKGGMATPFYGDRLVAKS